MDEDDQKVLLTAWLSRNRELLTWAMNPISVEHNQFQKYVPVLWNRAKPFELRQKSGSDVANCAQDLGTRLKRHVKRPSRIHFRFRSPCSSYSAVDSQIVKYMVYAETYKSLHNPVETQWKIKKIEG